MRNKILYLFVLATLFSYLTGYYLYPMDRSIFSWVYLIHFLSPQLLLLFVLASFAAAYCLSGVDLTERFYPAVLILLALLCSIPLFNLPQFTPDSIVYFAAARFIQERGFVDGLSGLWGVGYDSLPGYPLLLSLVFSVSDGYLAVKLLHLMLYLAVPLLVFLIGRRIWDSSTGFYGGLLSLSTPIILSNSYFMLIDVPLTVSILLLVYSLLRSETEPVWLLATILSAFVALTLKIGGLLFVVSVVFPAVIMLLRGRLDRGRILRVAVFSVVFLAVVALVVLSLPSLQKRIIAQVGLLNIFDNLKRFVNIWNSDPTVGLPFVVGFPQFLLFTAFILLSLKRMDRRHILFFSWILIPFLVAHDTKARYLLPMFPAVSLCAASAVRSVSDLRTQKQLVYFSCLVMLSVALYADPDIARGYVFKNLQVQAMKINDLPMGTVGVYGYAEPLIRNPHLFVPAVDYYSSGRVVFLGFNWAQKYNNNTETWARDRGLLNAIYTDMDYNPEQIDSIIQQNYTLSSVGSGGWLKYYDSYYAKLFLRKAGKAGPTDAIIYVSNIDVQDDEMRNKSSVCGSYAYSFYCNRKYDLYHEAYLVGPIKLATTYGIDADSWLGQNMLYMKPPNVGQVNMTYSIVVPANTSLKFSVSLRPDTWHPLKGDGTQFRVLVFEDGDPTTLYDRYIDPKNREGDRHLFEENLDVSRWWGRNVTVVLQTMSGPNNNSMYDTAGWGNPRLVYSQTVSVKESEKQ